MIVNPEHQPIWSQAQAFLQTRSNDVHTFYCYKFAQQLLHLEPEAAAKVVLPAILLHDTGWSTVPDDKVLYAFGPHMRYPELRRQHEVEGVRIAREILGDCGYEVGLIEQVTDIIDGHDTRKEAHSLNDRVFRDADKMWAFTPFGMDTVSVWFDYSTAEYLEMLTRWQDTRFYTTAGASMARGLLVSLRLMIKGEA